jgi:hypothetical protein
VDVAADEAQLVGKFEDFRDDRHGGSASGRRLIEAAARIGPLIPPP